MGLVQAVLHLHLVAMTQPDTNLKPDRYFDDLAVGERWQGRDIHVTEEEIVRFARAYDPQPMHADPDAAADGRFGGVIASGWNVAALVMRDNVDTSPTGSAPMLGMEVERLRWLRPVRAGDVLRAQREITGLRLSRSKPDRGIVRMKTDVTNQEGDQVMTFSVVMQLPVRPAAD
ncbi:MAG: MaoC family dehydratase [Pararhizobium sp.]